MKKYLNFAEGNFKHTIDESDLELKDKIGEQNKALHSMGNKHKEIKSNILNNANFLAYTSIQINNATNQISTGANEKLASAEEVVSSIEEMLSNMEINAENTARINIISSNTDGGIKNLNDVSHQSLNSVELIAQKSFIISDIAFQTNILAAAIRVCVCAWV